MQVELLMHNQKQQHRPKPSAMAVVNLQRAGRTFFNQPAGVLFFCNTFLVLKHQGAAVLERLASEQTVLLLPPYHVAPTETVS